MAKRLYTGWRVKTPGNCRDCGSDSDWGIDGGGAILCSCSPDFDESYDMTEAHECTSTQNAFCQSCGKVQP